MSHLSSVMLQALEKGIRTIHLQGGVYGTFDLPKPIFDIKNLTEGNDAQIDCNFSDGSKETYYYRRDDLYTLFAEKLDDGHLVVPVSENTTLTQVLDNLSKVYGRRFRVDQFQTFKLPRVLRGQTAICNLLARYDSVSFRGCITLRLKNAGV